MRQTTTVETQLQSAERTRRRLAAMMLPINNNTPRPAQRSTLAPEEIEALLGASPKDAAPVERPTLNTSSDSTGDELDQLLRRAEQAIASVDESKFNIESSGLQSFRLEDLDTATRTAAGGRLEAWHNAELDLRIELGSTHLHVSEIKALRKGTVVPLDKLEHEPVDVYANGELIARGEVLVFNDKLCVRVVELIAHATAKAG
jgi:flagellar motor switch protein FliN/FliY